MEMLPPPSPGFGTGLPERRIVLLGKTAVGKSASGNTILGGERFLSELNFICTTKKSVAQRAVVDGRLVTVVDTPGLFDTGFSQEDFAAELGRSIYECRPHAFLIVLSLHVKYTEQEKEVIEIIRQLLGEQAAMYSFILFTHGDALEGKNVEELIGKSQGLCDVIQLCGGRYHVFNNNKRDRDQVTTLLDKIDRMVEGNLGSFYNEEMYKDAERLRKEEKERIHREENERKYERLERITKDTETRVRKEIEVKLEKLKRAQEEEREKLTRDRRLGTRGSGPGDGLFKRHWRKLLLAAMLAAVIGNFLKWRFT